MHDGCHAPDLSAIVLICVRVQVHDRCEALPTPAKKPRGAFESSTLGKITLSCGASRSEACYYGDGGRIEMLL